MAEINAASASSDRRGRMSESLLRKLFSPASMCRANRIFLNSNKFQASRLRSIFHSLQQLKFMTAPLYFVCRVSSVWGFEAFQWHCMAAPIHFSSAFSSCSIRPLRLFQPNDITVWIPRRMWIVLMSENVQAASVRLRTPPTGILHAVRKVDLEGLRVCSAGRTSRFVGNRRVCCRPLAARSHELTIFCGRA